MAFMLAFVGAARHVLAGAAQKGGSGATFAVCAQSATSRLIGALARDVFEPRPLHCRQRACCHSRGAPVKLAAQASSPPQLGSITASGNYLAAVMPASNAMPGRLRPTTGRRSNVTPATVTARPRVPLFLVDGEVDQAVKYADRVVQLDKNDRVARLVLGVHALKPKQYPAARRDLAQSVRGPITDLTATSLSAWSITAPTTPTVHWPPSTSRRAGLVCNLQRSTRGHDLRHRGQPEGTASVSSMPTTRATALRVVEAYGSWVWRNQSPKEALTIFETSTSRYRVSTCCRSDG